MADFDVKELAVELLRELKNVATGGNSSGQDYGEGKGDPTTINLTSFNNAVDKMAEKLSAFATQIGINVDALKAIPGASIGFQSTNDTSKAFGDAVNLLSKEMGTYVNKLEQIRLQAAAGSNVGIGQGDAITQRAQFQAAGYKNFEDGLQGVTDASGNFKGSLSGLGYSADESTKRFNKFSEQLANAPEIKELIKKNLIQPTDVPKLAMIAAQGKTNVLDTPESRAKLVTEMAREAQMISQMSNAYGISKQAIMDNAIANNENTEAQIRQGALADDNARRALRTAQAISIPGGKSLSDLVSKLSTGARLSKEDRAMLSVGTMGMGGQLTSAVKDVQRTKDLAVDDPQRIAAENRLAGVQAEIRARLVSVEGQRLAQSMKEGPQRAALEKMITEARPAALAEKKIRESTGVGYAESAKIAQQNIGAAQIRGEQQQLSGANAPVANTGAKVSETLAEVNLAFIKNAAAVSGVLGELNVKLGDTATAFQKVKNVLTNELGPGPANESVEEKKNRLRPLANVIEGAVTPSGGTSQDLNRRSGLNPDGSIAGPVTLTTPSTTVNANNVTVTPTNPPSATPVTPTMRLNPNGTASEIPPAVPLSRPVVASEPTPRLTDTRPAITPAPISSPATRGTGTLGETGFPTEMKDIVAKLHKGETVLTPEQMKNLISGTGMMSASDTASAMLSSMTGTKGGNQSGGIDITKIFNSANTNISSANKPAPLTSDIVYTGTLKALKEVNGVTTTSPAKSEVKIPAIPAVKVAVPEVKIPAIPAVKVAVPEVKIPAIPPVTVTTPGVKVPAIKTDKTDSIIDKQLAKFGIDIGNLSGKLPNTPSVPKLQTGEVQYQNVVDKGPKTTAELAIINAERAASGQQAADIAASKARFSSGLYAQPKVDSESSGLNVKKMFDSVSTSISSVTGGGSTTRKSVQNEDSKAAQSQLDAVMGQYDKDRASIRSKISESLGPDAKKGDVLKELRVNPESVALEAQMKSMSRDLSDRIGAGTSIETKFDSGIQRGNIVEKTSTSVPITDAMKGYEPLGEETDDGIEPEKLETDINLSDSTLKTKDLHDQLIQLNTTMRELVEHSAKGVETAGAQVKATRSLSGNRFA